MDKMVQPSSSLVFLVMRRQSVMPLSKNSRPHSVEKSIARLSRKSLGILSSQDDTEKEFVFLEMDRIPYDGTKKEYIDQFIKESITEAMGSLRLNNESKNAVLQILTESREFLQIFYIPLFWMLHFKLHRPTENKPYKKNFHEASKLWSLFMFPLQTEFNYKPKQIDAFLDCFPYFTTQVLQQVFILASEGNPITARKEFRMKLCREIVIYFTKMPILDSLMLSTLTRYFSKPPPADIPDKILYPLPVNERTSVLVPTEDLKTLIDLDQRVLPVPFVFKATELSPAMQASSKHALMPGALQTEIAIEIPRNSASDWTTNLPELLPEPGTAQQAAATADSYDPMRETRSLVHRSRRPGIVADYQTRRHEFVASAGRHDRRIVRAQRELNMNIARAYVCRPATLDRLCAEIKRLRDENKREDTASFSEDPARLDARAARRIEEVSRMDPLTAAKVLPLVETDGMHERQRRSIKTIVGRFMGTAPQAPPPPPRSLEAEKDFIDQILVDFKIKHEDLMYQD